MLFYGRAGCSDCVRSQALLDKLKKPYEYIDIEKTPGAPELVEQITGGIKKVPTIVLPDGTVLIEPSDSLLQQAVEKHKL